MAIFIVYPLMIISIDGYQRNEMQKTPRILAGAKTGCKNMYAFLPNFERIL